MNGNHNNEQDNIAHLLRRAGFGATHDEVDAWTRKGLDATIRALVHFDTVVPESDFDRVQDRLQGDILTYNDFADLQLWWIQKMAHTDRPLQEKMTLFWHGHFASAYSKVRSPEMMYRQNQLFRNQGMGNFKALTLAVSRDPAMILYLDNQTNRKGHANENYARELFELFTLSIGNYTEQDIHEAARAFTGWATDRLTNTYRFLPRQHDDTPKTVFGKTGNWNGEDIVEMAVTHPACATFICTKLFKFFVHDTPQPAEVRPFAQVFVRSNFEIKPVLEAMFRSPVFYSQQARWANIKSPVEFVIGALRSTSAELPIRFVPQSLKAMGQELFNPPNVKGWDGGATWINTTTLLTRFNFAMQLAKLNEENLPLLQDLEARIAQNQLRTPEEIVDHFTIRLLNRTVSPQTRQVLLTYLQTGANGSPQNFDIAATGKAGRDALLKVHGLLHVMMLTPEYQLV